MPGLWTRSPVWGGSKGNGLVFLLHINGSRGQDRVEVEIKTKESVRKSKKVLEARNMRLQKSSYLSLKFVSLLILKLYFTESTSDF